MKNETEELVADQMRNDLISQISNARMALDAMHEDDIQVISPDFDCSQSFNYTANSICEIGIFNPIDESKRIDNLKPTLYWFEIVGEGGNSSIADALNKYKSKIEKGDTAKKALPAIKKNAGSNNTSILYIGKVKKGFETRLMQHFGFKLSDKTQGLRFCEWAGSIHQEIRLHYIQFNSNDGVIADLMSFFEYRLACNHKPLIGKHT